MAKSARTPYLNASGPDAVNVSVPAQTFNPGDLVSLTATLDDTRYNNSNGTEATQNIALAEYYIDVVGLPGEGIAMTAVDGAFDTRTEEVTAPLSIASLSEGQHTVYVRAQDVTGEWGVPQALVRPPPGVDARARRRSSDSRSPWGRPSASAPCSLAPAPTPTPTTGTPTRRPSRGSTRTR